MGPHIDGGPLACYGIQHDYTLLLALLLDWAGCSFALKIGLVDVFGFMMARLIKITWSFFKFEKKKTLEQVTSELAEH